MSDIAQPAFFEATAQLIPLLFIAVLVESRLRLPSNGQPNPHPFRSSLLRFGLLFAVVLGEGCSLAAIAVGPTAFETAFVVQILGVLGVLFLAPAVFQELDEVRDHVRTQWGRRLVITVATFVATSPLLAGVVMTII